MFAAIVVISVLIGLLFVAAAVSFVVFIYSAIRKNDALKKKSFKFLVPSAVLWVVFIGINAALIVAFLYNRVVQKLQFLNNNHLKMAKCRAFCGTCSRTNRVLEQV
jgi:hypothetical protein